MGLYSRMETCKAGSDGAAGREGAHQPLPRMQVRGGTWVGRVLAAEGSGSADGSGGRRLFGSELAAAAAHGASCGGQQQAGGRNGTRLTDRGGC